MRESELQLAIMTAEPTSNYGGPAERLPRALSGFGALLAAVLAGEVIVAWRSPPPSSLKFLVGAVSSAPFIVGLVGGGHWLRRSELSADRYVRIGWWCVGGGAVFLLVNLALMVPVPAETTAVLIGWLRWSVSLGSGTGLLIGLFEARAIEREVAAQRASVEAREARERRELLDYLNSLLRHEVLNTANVIDGYAELLAENHELDDAAREHVAVIRSETDELSTTLQDVRILLDAAKHTADLEPVDLNELLTDELRKLRRRHDAVETELSCSERTVVRADPLLKRAFANLLSNAVEHNDSATPRVSVDVESTGDTATVRIADNGPGLPPEKRDSPFEPESSGSPDHGLGLVIVDTLVRRYDGSVELADTGPDGSVFVVELPAASDDARPTADGDGDAPAGDSAARRPART